MPTKSFRKTQAAKGQVGEACNWGDGERGGGPPPLEKCRRGLDSREGLPHQSPLNKSLGEITPRHPGKKPVRALMLCPPVDNILPSFSHTNRKGTQKTSEFHMTS